MAIYDYKETRGQEHPQVFLKNFKGFLHTDGYQSYHNPPSDIVVVGCFSHARRKFEDMLKKIPKDKQKGMNAEIGVAYINALFSYEREFAGLSPLERHKKRLEKSKPVSDAFLGMVYKFRRYAKNSNR